MGLVALYHWSYGRNVCASCQHGCCFCLLPWQEHSASSSSWETCLQRSTDPIGQALKTWRQTQEAGHSQRMSQAVSYRILTLSTLTIPMPGALCSLGYHLPLSDTSRCCMLRLEGIQEMHKSLAPVQFPQAMVRCPECEILLLLPKDQYTALS